MSNRGFLAVGILVVGVGVVLAYYGGFAFRSTAGQSSAGSVDAVESHEPATANDEPSKNTSSQNRRPQAEQNTHPPLPHSKPEPLLKGWPKPALAIVLSGEQHGYLEPCGCTELQSGGVSRRADLFRQIGEKGWSLTALDLGGTVKRARRQSQIKFETMLDAMRDMHYAALALGPEELNLGPDYLLSQHIVDPDSPDTSLAFLGANIVLFDTPDLGTPARWKLLTVDGVTIGVTAILGRHFKQTGLLEMNIADLKIEEPEKVLPGIVKQLQDLKPDLMILLSHTSLDESRKLAGEFPDFDLVLSAGGAEDPIGEPEWVGGTMLVTVGHKGKYVGVVGYYPGRSQNRLQFELVNLDQQRFRETQSMVEHMRSYQNRLLEERIVALEKPIRHPSEATFVGAETCGDCHTQAYEISIETDHAHAFESLKHAREGQKDHGITRIYDPECLACHVTGWEPQQVLRYESGFLNKEFAETDADKQRSLLLQGTQCESCHGPGSKHVALAEDDDLDTAPALMEVTLAQAKTKLCYRCHDLDNSPNFDFDEYWKKIRHKGFD